MKRGVTKKYKINKKLFLERKMLGVYDVLNLDRDNCICCGICVKVCPKEAFSLSKSVIRNGKLEEKGTIDIDADKCTFCGECVVLCPTTSIEILRNEREIIPVIETGVFPKLFKEIVIDVKRCNPSCNLVCEEVCPTKAVRINTVKSKSGEITRILDVKVDEKKCIFCGKCEQACPQTIIKVLKPFQGSIHLNMELCPKNCQACADVCPSGVFFLFEDGKVKIDESFCIYCEACEEVCPEKNIRIERSRVLCTEIKSGAWISTLEKLISYPSLVKGLYANAAKKQVELIKNSDRL